LKSPGSPQGATNIIYVAGHAPYLAVVQL